MVRYTARNLLASAILFVLMTFMIGGGNTLLAAPAPPPVPAFIFSPSNPVIGSPVYFDGSSTTCSGRCSYKWTDDADGALLGRGVKMSFTFQDAGTKYVRLTVTDGKSQRASVEHDVIVSQSQTLSPPVPAFTYSPANPVVGSAVSFDGSSSTCAAAPCSFLWTDDVDNSQLGTGITISLTFQTAGTKKVRLTVTDAQSRAASVERDVIVSDTSNPPVVAGAFYVSTSGNDLNAGTSASPWRTIQKAANTLTAGDTVIITAGTYNERVKITRSGSSGKVITFQAQGPVVTQGFSIQASYVKVDGFEMVSTGSGWSDRSNGSGVYLSGTNNTISNNRIHNTTAAGIYLTSSASNSTVSANSIAYAVECGIFIQGTNNLIVSNDISHSRDIGGSDADGIRFFGSGNTVRQNSVHDIKLSDSPGQTPHIDCFQTWGPATSYVFEQNLCDKNADGHKQGFTIEGITQPVGDIIIRNNVLITRGTGYQPDANVGDMGLVTNVTIANNTMVAVNGPVEYAIWLFTNLRGVVVKNNAIYDHGNSSEPYILVQSGASGLDIGFNSISKSDGRAPTGFPYAGDLWMVNPLFLNLSTGDFHLQSTSPLITRGINLSVVTNDYDGVTRPSTVPPDIGAFEYHAP